MLLIITISLFLLSCSQNKINDEIQKQNQQDVKIGVILPLTGNQNVYGQGVLEGLNLALEEINTQGKRAIQLVYEDNQGSTKNSVSAAQKLISVDNVSLLISSVSQHPVAVAPLAEEYKIPLYTIAAHASKLNTAGDFVFKNDDNYNKLGTAAAQFLIQNNHNRVGAIYSQYNDANVEAAQVFRNIAENEGAEVYEESFSEETTDFKTNLLKLDKQGVTAIFVTGLVKDNALIFKQIKELGMTQQIVANSAAEDPQVISVAGNGAEGVIFFTYNGFPPDSFKEKVLAKYGHEPLRWTMEAYDGLHIIDQAITRIHKNQSITPLTIQQQLSNIKEYDGVAGKIFFDEEGNAQRDLFIKIIKDEKFQVYSE